MKRLVPVVLLCLVTACGSTVQVTSSSQVGPGTATGLGDVPAASAAVPGSTGSTAVGSSTGSVVTVPGAVRPGSSSSGPSATTTTSGIGATTGPGPAVAADGAPVEVGFFAVKDLAAATKALGVQGLATGNGAKQARTAAALVNSRGGLAGHKVVPVVFEYDATGDQNNQYQAACGLFFDDHKVRAVVSAVLVPTLRACTAKKGVPFLSSGNRTTAAVEIARYPLTALPPQMSLERVVDAWLPSLEAQGWFAPGSKIGLLYNEDTDYSVAPSLVEQGLKALGLTLTDKQAMPGTDDTSRVSAASSAGQSAALRFASAGIDRVLALDKSGQALSYFALAAQNQGYYPAYGLTSLSLPALLRTVLSARQLDNARGIGWSPSVDVPAKNQPDLGPNSAACLKAMSASGEDMSSSGTRFSALSYCDGIVLLSQSWKDPQLSPSTFLPGLRSLGTTYSPMLSFRADFTSHVDGNAAYRPIAFDAGCDCFAYTGPLAVAR